MEEMVLKQSSVPLSEEARKKKRKQLQLLYQLQLLPQPVVLVDAHHVIQNHQVKRMEHTKLPELQRKLLPKPPINLRIKLKREIIKERLKKPSRKLKKKQRKLKLREKQRKMLRILKKP